MSFNNAMLDVETLGTKPGCVILSIAVVPFNMDGDYYNISFYEKISLTNSMKYGFKIDENTLKWWLKQDSGVFEGELKEGKLVADVLADLVEYFSFKEIWGGVKPKVWGNGSTFDCSIVQAYFNALDIKPAWDNINDRDIRTIIDLAPQFKKNELFIGDKHNPVDDCIHQIKYLTKTYNHINPALVI